jgi:hypothetical protein
MFDITFMAHPIMLHNALTAAVLLVLPGEVIHLL